MIYQRLIDKYRSLKKQSYLRSIGRFKKTYAFLGVGEHSLNNLFPCLQHLNVSLKYIYSRTLSNAEKVCHQFPGAVAVDDYTAILKDDTVDGVFICLRPEHQTLALRSALEAGKHVFVEKPPCNTLNELRQLAELSNGLVCIPSLQRRYAPYTNLIQSKKLTQGATSYQYRFGTGAYREGDVNTDLFIHAIDFLLRIFGDTTNVNVQSIRNASGATTHLQLIHKSGVHGQAELSSHYLWNKVHDELNISCSNHLVYGSYPDELYKIEKKSILNVPLEKVRSAPLIKHIYLDQRSFVPSMQNNTLYSQGFYPMVLDFLEQCEKGIPVRENQLKTLAGVYELIEKIRKS